jgi:hypothetical protein
MARGPVHPLRSGRDRLPGEGDSRQKGRPVVVHARPDRLRPTVNGRHGLSAVYGRSSQRVRVSHGRAPCFVCLRRARRTPDRQNSDERQEPAESPAGPFRASVVCRSDRLHLGAVHAQHRPRHPSGARGYEEWSPPRPGSTSMTSASAPASDDRHGGAHCRNSRIAVAMSPAWVSRAKWPVSKKRTTACGMSRLKASAPAGRKNGSFFPHTASNGGRWVRK